MQRRDFLKISGSLSLSLTQGLDVAFASAKKSLKQKKRIIYVFLNGGADSLSILFPKRELQVLSGLRKNLIFDLNHSVQWGEYLGHPALRSLQNLWDSGQVSFIHQSGFIGNKSHSVDKRFMQTLKNGDKNIGLFELLNKSNNSLSDNIYCGPIKPPFIPQAAPSIMVEEKLPESLNMPKGWEKESLFTKLEIAEMKNLLKVNKSINKILGVSDKPKNDFEMVGDLIVKNFPFQFAYIEVEGWDTHALQGVNEGGFASNFSHLMQSISSLVKTIGPNIDNTLIFITSEFGRRVKENGSLGSEHGSGGLQLLIGGNQINKTKDLTRWQSLSSLNTKEDIDLPVTTDIRDIWASIISDYLNVEMASNSFENHRVKALQSSIFKKL